MIVEKFRTRPVLVDAVRWDGTREMAVEIARWVNGRGGDARVATSGDLYVNGFLVRPGWYVYWCSDGWTAVSAEWFAEEYEPVRPEEGDQAAIIERRGEHDATGLSEVLAPVLAARFPDKSLDEITEMTERLKAIGVSESAVRYQVEHGLIGRSREGK